MAANPNPAPSGSAPPAPSPAEAADKPGYMTTEFWISGLTLALTLAGGIAAMLFHWSGAQADNWTQGVQQLAPLLAMVIAFLVSRQYVNGRIDLKKALADAAAAHGDQVKQLLLHLTRGGANPVAGAAPAGDQQGGATGSFTVAGVTVSVQNGRVVDISVPQTNR